MILHVKRIVVGKVGNRVISKTIAAKLLCIGVQHHLLRAWRYKESVIGVRTCGREIEDKHQVATHVAQHLVTVVMPDFLNGRSLEVLLALNDFEHLSIEIT